MIQLNEMRDTFVQIFKDKPETSFNSDSSHNNEGRIFLYYYFNTDKN